MKYFALLLIVVSPLSFAGRVVDKKNTTSSSGNEDAMILSDSDEEYDDNDQPFDSDSAEQGLTESLGSRPLLSGESLTLSKKRSSESSEREGKMKRRRVEPSQTGQILLQTPIPAEGGILLQLFQSGVREWHEPFFGALDPLDVLSLYAASQTANLRMRNDLVLVIRTRQELYRLVALPARSHAFFHLVKLVFNFDINADDAYLIAHFLRTNASVLANLTQLVLNTYEHPALAVFLLQEALDDQLAALLVRLHCDLVIDITELNFQHYLNLLPWIQEHHLDRILALRFADVAPEVLQGFLDAVPQAFAPTALIIRGPAFDDAVMSFFARRLDMGYFKRLRALELIDIGVTGAGFNVLGQLLALGYLHELRSLHLDQRNADPATMPSDALGRLFGEFNLDENIALSLTHLRHFALVTDNEGFISPDDLALFFQLIRLGAFPALTSLEIEGALDDDAAEDLVQLAPHLQDLQLLDLSGNQQISPQKIGRLRAALPNCRIFVPK